MPVSGERGKRGKAGARSWPASRPKGRGAQVLQVWFPETASLGADQDKQQVPARCLEKKRTQDEHLPVAHSSYLGSQRFAEFSLPTGCIAS